jgi:23S rRNA G2069 N7-methylase RlmK/C1962 C5-methylase RlmI
VEKSGCTAAIRGVYRADVANVRAEAGDIVQIRSPRGRTLGAALYSDRSQIALRLLSYGDAPADIALIRRRLESAIAFRQSLAIDASAYRLVHGRSGPPAVADCRSLTATTWSFRRSRRGMDSADAGADDDARRAVAAARGFSRATIRALESSKGSSNGSRVVAGELPGVRDGHRTGIEYDVDLRRGQKTGLFPRPAGKPGGGRRLRTRPAARLLQATTAALRWCWAARATRRSPSTSRRMR